MTRDATKPCFHCAIGKLMVEFYPGNVDANDALSCLIEQIADITCNIQQAQGDETMHDVVDFVMALMVNEFNEIADGTYKASPDYLHPGQRTN